MAKLFKATETFGTVLMYEGENVPVHFEEGDEREVEDWMVDLLAKDCPGSLVAVKAKAKKPKPVETAAGPTEDASTRQVVGAGSSEKPPAKKAVKKTTTKNPVKFVQKKKGSKKGK